MSTFTDREEFLRRALRAAVDGIEPGADGLQRIQRRLGRPRPLALAWAEAVWTDVLLRAPGGFQSALEWVVRVAQLAWERFGPTTRTGGGRAARTMRWIRPLAALGVSVSIVAVGAYVALDAQQAIFPSTASSAQSSGGQPGSGGGVGGGAGSATTKKSSPVGGIIPFPGTTASRNCTSGKPSASPSPGVGSITPPSPTPSTSASDGGTDSPSTSTSDAPSPNPSGSASTAPADGPTTSASTPTAGGSSSAGTSKAPKPGGSSSPCGRRTVTRNPPLVGNPQTQASPPAAQVSPSPSSGTSDSAAALGFARLEEIG